MAAKVLVWGDIRKNIEVLQLIVSMKPQKDRKEVAKPSGKSRKMEITVLPSNIFVKHAVKLNGGHVKERNPKPVCVAFQDISINPISCQGLSVVEEQELQMRLHINNPQKLRSRDSIGLQSIDEERKDLQKGPIKMVCKMCGNTIIEERQFKRVLELPSEHWQQVSQNLCCHGNVSNLSSLQEASFNPSEDDCLLGSYFIMVNADIVEAKHLTINQGETVIKCHRCTKPIGEIVLRNGLNESQVKGIKIHKHAVTTQNIDVFRHYSTELYLTKLLQARLQGRVNFKFLIKGTDQNGKSKPYLLLWILNPDAAVITNISSFTLEHMVHLNEQKTESKKACVYHGMKILYKVLLNNKDIKGSSSGGTDIITLPSEMCLHMLLVLTASHHTLPPTARQMEGFMVGYLKS